jgi:hypothetical protein
MTRPWSTSVQTQGIRLRRRALSSTAPDLSASIERKVAKRAALRTQIAIYDDNPSLALALEAISNMKKDD